MPTSRKKAQRQVSNSPGNGINPQFNLLSHLPNMGRQVELEIGSPTKHQCTNAISGPNIKALCSRCASVLRQVLALNYDKHTPQTRLLSAYNNNNNNKGRRCSSWLSSRWHYFDSRFGLDSVCVCIYVTPSCGLPWSDDNHSSCALLFPPCALTP